MRLLLWWGVDVWVLTLLPNGMFLAILLSLASLAKLFPHQNIFTPSTRAHPWRGGADTPDVIHVHEAAIWHQMAQNEQNQAQNSRHFS